MGSFEEKKLYYIESKKKVAIITIMLNTEVDRLEKHEITMLMYSVCPYIILSVLKTSKCIEGRPLQQTGFTPCCGGRRNSSAPGKGLMRNLAIIIVCKKE